MIRHKITGQLEFILPESECTGRKISKYSRELLAPRAHSVRTYNSQEPFSQQTDIGRLTELDRLVLKTIRDLGLEPKSFLDVGAAFKPTAGNLNTNPIPAQTTIDSKRFFDESGVPILFSAIDIVPIDGISESNLKEQGIEAFEFDYRKRPVSRKFSIIRMANVSINQTPKEFTETSANLFLMLERDGLLIVHNSMTAVRRRLSEGIEDEYVVNESGIYQKVSLIEEDRLSEISFMHTEEKIGAQCTFIA